MRNLYVVESRGQRVLTSAQIADCYDTTVDCIKQNFHANRDRFVEGKHYIVLTGVELKAFKNEVRIPHQDEKQEENEVRIPHSAEIKAKYQFDTQFKYAKILYLWTEKGALLHAKSLNTDKAWQVYDYLVDFYFRAKDEVKPEVKQSSQKMVPVVNVPENRKMLEAIQKARRDLTAMDVLWEELIRYHSEENYKEKVRAAAGVIPILVGDTSALLRMEPKIIQRPY